ncbi:hypothetical protein SDC9_56455 [bioreactor metagenome]|uniref:CUB domain-containing protein n=1 Tax=bioreactor metagenome TaxID=1076179 RepID=A0A644X2M5_9ZZZZ
MAQKFMSSKTSKSVSLIPVSYENKGITQMYFFTDESNTSFVVIAADKFATPVIAYSTESGLDAVLPDPVSDYFLGTELKLSEAEAKSMQSDQETSAEWESLSKTGALPVQLKSAVAPLLATTWNQDCYYNDSVPEHIDGPCGHCYAGCVATAMGQVMKYHNYPASGTGSNIYGTGAYSNIHVDYSQANYNWAAMPGSISSSNPEIAKLLYHAGVSVNMDYWYDGSGAVSQYAAEAFVDHFCYAPYVFYAERDGFADVDWIWVITNELKSFRPVYYSGQGSSGGHAFVCDGIDNSSKLHINWGWSGSGNGYYSINSLYGFNDGQAAIFGVEPSTGDIQYCQSTSVHTAATDTISDGSNEQRYGNNTNCSWTIQPPGAGLIVINFTELALDQDMDNVFIYSGTSTSDPLVATVSGFELPSQILVWGPSAYVVFQSDGMLRADGFEFYYVSSLTGMEEAWNNSKISVFPNPAVNDMNIEIDPLVVPAVKRIELISLAGQVVDVVENPQQTQTLQVGNLPSGTYGIRFLGENDSFSSFVEIQ